MSSPTVSAPSDKLARMFSFVDLFAGIGGFHAALSATGGRCTFASEIDQQAKAVYERNWGVKVDGDIVPLTEGTMAVPMHDVLAAGFPCQPFSKSGRQRGMDETRGTLFFNICRVLESHRPPVILLENVRNLAGPRQRDTWETIVRSLRELGYRVSDHPAVFSPHLLPSDRGGRPQVRERVFITGTYVGYERAMRETDIAPIVTPRSAQRFERKEWDLERDLPLDDDESIDDIQRYRLTEQETRWINAWNDFLQRIDEEKVPGFPIWADAFVSPAQIPPGTPAWKANFLQKNADLYERHRGAIDDWLERWNGLVDFPASRRKLEWQAQGSSMEDRDLWKTVMHFRPSGIRAKRPTYLPALVAITQTSIYGPRKRRITPREASRLQGIPEWFDFGDQGDAATYKQLGNGVNVGAAYYVFREHVLRDEADLRAVDDLGRSFGHLVDAVRAHRDQPAVLPAVEERELSRLEAHKPTLSAKR